MSPVLDLTLPLPSKRRRLALAAAPGVVLLVMIAPSPAATAAARSRQTTIEVYDRFSAPGRYSLTDYSEKWFNIYGLGELAGVDTRTFSGNRLDMSAAPFRTASDTSVFDHLKYLAVSTKTFPVPTTGAVEVSSDITAVTPGTVPGKVVHGRYTATGQPYAASTLEGQQAAAVMNVIDFRTGQLFDWFVSGHRAFALIERLPSTVTGGTTDPASPDYVGRDKMYTQIVREVPAGPETHRVAIRFSRDSGGGHADYLLDGAEIAHVDHVGVPLDRQGVPYTGTYPSLGPGEDLGGRIDSVAIGHGLFSLLDAFPFRHPEAPELDVSVPQSERLFGQGVQASFDNFRVTTTVR